jgi:ribosomal protein S18 acetylase RimI-like enzyme
MVVTIRAAKPTDLPRAARLFTKVLRELPYYNSLAKEWETKKYTRGKLAEKLKLDSYSVILAQENPQSIIGFCFNHFDDFTVWIDWFGVDPSARKHGVGAGLLEETINTAKNRRAHKVWCDSRSNNQPSKNLLRKIGFRDLVEIKNHWYGQDFILWEKFV